jgi:hypothetical protein
VKVQVPRDKWLTVGLHICKLDHSGKDGRLHPTTSWLELVTFSLLHEMKPVFDTGDQRAIDCTGAQLAVLNGGQWRLRRFIQRRAGSIRLP